MPRKRFALRSRNGFTLVLFAMMMSLIIAAAAFSADFGRMYVIRAQLQTAADAAALAAVQAQSSGVGLSSRDTGKKYVYLHQVSGRSNIDSVIARDSVGSWIVATSTWVPESDQSLWSIGTNTNGAAAGATRDAVKVVARDTVDFVFGKIFGWRKRVVSAEAIAVWGSVSASTCVRPWAVPYQMLLDQLYPPAGTKPVTYDLLPSDVSRLSQMTYSSNPVTLKVSSTNESYTGSSQFYAIRIPPAEYFDGTVGSTSSGGADYRAQIAATGCAELRALFGTTDPTIHIGDYLAPENGNMQGPTNQGISGQGQTPGICGTSNNCPTDPPVRIIAALWDTYGASPGGTCGTASNNGCYHVKYLAEFTLKGWDQSQKAVLGYFNLMTLPAMGSTGFTAGGSSTVLVKALVK